MGDPLAALRPLHEPPPIPWWPPAPGWWLLVLLILVAIALAFWWRKNRVWQRAALRELKAVEQLRDQPDQQAAVINRLLKRYALVCWPRKDVAALTGEAWLAFLDCHGGDGRFSKGPGRALLTLPYGGDTIYAEGLIRLARYWIKANKPDRRG